jgi:hypothetical protein
MAKISKFKEEFKEGKTYFNYFYEHYKDKRERLEKTLEEVVE